MEYAGNKRCAARGIRPGQLAALPALFTLEAKTAKRTLEFFTAQIRNLSTRRAYARAASRFASWCAEYGLDAFS